MTPCPSAVEYVTPVFAKNYQVSLTRKNWIFPAILENILWDMCSAFLSINCTQKQTKCLNKLVALLSFEIKSSAKRCAFHFVYLCITYLIWTVSGEQIKNERCLWNPVIPLWQKKPCHNEIVSFLQGPCKENWKKMMHINSKKLIFPKLEPANFNRVRQRKTGSRRLQHEHPIFIADVPILSKLFWKKWSL